MKLNIKVSPGMMNRLPREMVQRLVYEFAEWVYGEMDPRGCGDRVNQLSPLLIALLCKGEISLEAPV